MSPADGCHVVSRGEACRESQVVLTLPYQKTTETRPFCQYSYCVPSLKEPLLSRVVSEDFVVWVWQWFLVRCRLSAQSVRTDRFDYPRGCSVTWLSFVTNCLRLVPVLRLRLRGQFGRSFPLATVPQPVPSWTPADRRLRPRSGPFGPTPIRSIRSSCGTPGRSIIRITPDRNGQVKGTHRAGWEPQGFARPGRRINTVTRIERYLRGLVWDAILQQPDAEDRATVGTDPSAASGLEEE
jgi:hypothetical protein